MPYDELTKIITVSEMNQLIKKVLDISFYQIIVKGEISSYKPSQSGHIYFDLKDESSSINCVIFRSFTQNLPFFRVGDLVIATGRIGFYEKTGKLSFVATTLKKEGDGELQAQIEKRKLYYQNLGWFDPKNKIPLPETINKVGIVTSATGAVFHDILDVTKRRAPSLDIVLLPCAVQGEGAEVTISSRIRQANNFSLCDCLIIASGGGSQEDLAPFSTDEVIVAIHESKIPVISAVGHETDWSLSDYTASVRAGTPSIAAEIVTKTIFLRRERFNSTYTMMRMLMERKVSDARRRLVQKELLTSIIKEKLLRVKASVPDKERLSLIIERKKENALISFNYREEDFREAYLSKIKEKRNKLEALKERMELTLPHLIERGRKVIDNYRNTSTILLQSCCSLKKEKAQSTIKELKALSPLSVLDRGYAIVTKESGKVVSSAKDVKNGEIINIRVKKGSFSSIVEKEKKNEL